MGVRLYDSLLGRFLEVDPVEGGSANDYDYCSGDPVNCFDLLGTSASVVAVHAARPSQCLAALNRPTCTVEDIKAKVQAADQREAKAREASQRANVMEGKEQRTARPRAPAPEKSMPTSDAFRWIVGHVIGDPVGAAVGCGVYGGVGAVVGGAGGALVGQPAAGARGGAAIGCVVGGGYGGHGPPYPQ